MNLEFIYFNLDKWTKDDFKKEIEQLDEDIDAIKDKRHQLFVKMQEKIGTYNALTDLLKTKT